MKKMYVKRLLAGMTIGTILTGTVSGCGMISATAPAANAPMCETAPESYSEDAYYVEETAPAEEYDEYDMYETEAADVGYYVYNRPGIPVRRLQGTVPESHRP